MIGERGLYQLLFGLRLRLKRGVLPGQSAQKLLLRGISGRFVAAHGGRRARMPSQKLAVFSRGFWRK